MTRPHSHRTSLPQEIRLNFTKTSWSRVWAEGRARLGNLTCPIPSRTQRTRQSWRTAGGAGQAPGRLQDEAQRAARGVRGGCRSAQGVMDMHAVEWKSSEKTATLPSCSTLLPPISTAPRSLSLRKKLSNATQVENTKRSGTATANSCTSILAERARFTASLGRTRIPKAFQARSSPSCANAIASKSQWAAIPRRRPRRPLARHGHPTAPWRGGLMGRIVGRIGGKCSRELEFGQGASRNCSQYLGSEKRIRGEEATGDRSAQNLHCHSHRSLARAACEVPRDRIPRLQKYAESGEN